MMGMKWQTILIGKWTWYRPLVSIAFIYLLLAMYAVFFAERMIFLPPRASYGEGEPGLLRLPTGDGGTIAAVHLPAAAGMPTLLYSHGNAEDIGHSAELHDVWHAAGVGVFAYDYPGYGLSTGRPTERSANVAARAAWDHLIGLGVDAGSIVIVGRSVGSGPATRLAADVDAAGVVLISPLTSAYGVMVPSWLFPRDRFRNLRLMPGIETPLLVIHGAEDAVIPPSHGKRLYAASGAGRKSLHIAPAAGHNDLFFVHPGLPGMVSAFAIEVAGGAVR